MHSVFSKQVLWPLRKVQNFSLRQRALKYKQGQLNSKEKIDLPFPYFFWAVSCVYYQSTGILLRKK